jgi:hypothetical protein
MVEYDADHALVIEGEQKLFKRFSDEKDLKFNEDLILPITFCYTLCPQSR